MRGSYDTQCGAAEIQQSSIETLVVWSIQRAGYIMIVYPDYLPKAQ